MLSLKIHAAEHILLFLFRNPNTPSYFFYFSLYDACNFTPLPLFLQITKQLHARNITFFYLQSKIPQCFPHAISYYSINATSLFSSCLIYHQQNTKITAVQQKKNVIITSRTPPFCCHVNDLYVTYCLTPLFIIFFRTQQYHFFSLPFAFLFFSALHPHQNSFFLYSVQYFYILWLDTVIFILLFLKRRQVMQERITSVVCMISKYAILTCLLCLFRVICSIFCLASYYVFSSHQIYIKFKLAMYENT